MRGDPAIVELLNELLTAELTAINQYYVHYKMCENWGYKRLAKKKYDESIEEMKHADDVIERILFLDGIPNMQRYNSVAVGEDPIEQHKRAFKPIDCWSCRAFARHSEAWGISASFSSPA